MAGLRVISFLTAILLSLSLAAQDVKVRLVTFGPGPNFFELEGHSGIRIMDSEADRDYIVNWGLFDFAAPNFLWRFVKGETDYMSGVAPTVPVYHSYRNQGRSITEQSLNLTTAQKQRLLDLIAENLRPENATYRYNYLSDNCSTRPLQIIERAVGDTLTLGLPATQGPSTFRRIMRKYHASYPWYQFGIDLALGAEIDRPMSERAKTFAPVELVEMISGATLPDSLGRQIPVVTETYVICQEKAGGAILPPTPWWQTPMSIMWTVFAIALGFTLYDFRRGTPGRVFDTVFYLIIGLGGCVVAFLVFVSTHAATSPNWVLLWLNPLALIIVGAMWIRRLQKVAFYGQIVNFALILALMAIGIIGIQHLNAAFWPLMLADMLRSASYVILTKDQCQQRANSQSR